MAAIEKYRFVDEARGLAILLVIVVHCSQPFHDLSGWAKTFAGFGQTGVQLFFVASAFTLCTSSFTRRFDTRKISSFYIRRVFRIAPMYYIGIIIYATAMIVQKMSAGEPLSAWPYTLVNVLSNLTFLHGLYPPANNNVVFGGWSIGTEMAFYALFPWLFQIITWACERSRRIGILIPAVLAIFIIGFETILVIFFGYTVHNNSFEYFLILNQMPVFSIGITYWVYLTHYPNNPLLKSVGLSVTFVLSGIILLGGIWLLDPSGALTFTIVPALGGVTFAFLINLLRLTPINLLVLVKIGKNSYSMYIVHFIFAWMLVPWILSSTLQGWIPEILMGLNIIATTLFSFGVANFTERFVENYFIRLGSKITSVSKSQKKQVEP